MLLGKVTVSPMHSQVDLFVPDGQEDLPEWPEDEPLTHIVHIVATSECIYVGTISDMEGQVSVEAWLGESPAQETEPVYDGAFQVYHAGALVGSWTGNHLALLPLPEGSYHVRVFTFPEGSAHPDRVLFALEALVEPTLRRDVV